MLVFLDESYEADGASGYRHALGGFGIDERQYRRLAAAVHQCKQRYFLEVGSMTPDEIRTARASWIVTAEPPEDAEIRAAKLLTAKQADYHAVHGSATGVLMAGDLLQALADTQSSVFGVLSYPSGLAEIQGPVSVLPRQFVWLLERVELWMQEQHADASAIIVPDTVHEGIDHHLSRRIADFLFRSTQGKRMRHIVPNPFWVDSRTTAGSQLADVVAHILMNGMRPEGQRKPLDHLWRQVVALEFRSVDLTTRGIRRLRKQQTGAEAH